MSDEHANLIHWIKETPISSNHEADYLISGPYYN